MTDNCIHPAFNGAEHRPYYSLVWKQEDIDAEGNSTAYLTYWNTFSPHNPLKNNIIKPPQTGKKSAVKQMIYSLDAWIWILCIGAKEISVRRVHASNTHFFFLHWTYFLLHELARSRIRRHKQSSSGNSASHNPLVWCRGRWTPADCSHVIVTPASD